MNFLDIFEVKQTRFDNCFLRLFEMDQEYADYAFEKPADILPHIFQGNTLRLAEPLMNGKKYEVEDFASQELGDYSIDWDKWVGYKLSDADKKNPTKLNKLLNKRKVALQKQAQQLDPESEEFERVNSMFDQVDRLLKIPDLKGTYNAPSTLVLIYSRAPIDTIRMSDHGDIASCHSTGGQYFSHALADAGCAGVTYVITAEDFERIENLQAPEIFSDSDRGIEGITPLARTRIRVVFGPNGEQVGVPTKTVYGSREIIREDLYKQTMAFFKKHQQEQAEAFRDTLGTRRGGTYEDWGDGVADNFERMFGFRPKISADSSDVDDVKNRFDFGGSDNDIAEMITDQIRSVISDMSEDPAGMSYDLYDGENFSISYSSILSYDGNIERAKKILSRLPGTMLEEIKAISDTKLEFTLKKTLNPREVFTYEYDQMQYIDPNHMDDYGDIDLELDTHGVVDTWNEHVFKLRSMVSDEYDSEDDNPDLSEYYVLQGKLLGVNINTIYIYSNQEYTPESDEFHESTELVTAIERRVFITAEQGCFSEIHDHLEKVIPWLEAEFKSTSIVEHSEHTPLLSASKPYRLSDYPADAAVIKLECIAVGLSDPYNHDTDRNEYEDVAFLTGDSFPKFLIRALNRLGKYELLND